MKLLVINDVDGRTQVYPRDLRNLKILLGLLLKTNEWNTILETPDKGLSLLESSQATIAEIESYLEDNGPVGRSACVQFVDLKEALSAEPNPFW